MEKFAGTIELRQLRHAMIIALLQLD